MSKSHINQKIDLLLVEKGISKSRFYSDCGITSASYSQWNTGKTKPKLSTLYRIAEYLDTTVDYLIAEPDNEEKPAPNVEDELDDTTKELVKIAYEIDEADRLMLLEMARSIRKRRES